MQSVLIDDRRIHVDFSQSVSKLHKDWISKRTGNRESMGGFNHLQKRTRYRDGEGRGNREEDYDLVFDTNKRDSKRQRSDGDRPRSRRDDDRGSSSRRDDDRSRGDDDRRRDNGNSRRDDDRSRRDYDRKRDNDRRKDHRDDDRRGDRDRRRDDDNSRRRR
jgi:peptidyl-prolyl cis-trans isomerase-like 4